jgi:hypothetical protein
MVSALDLPLISEYGRNRRQLYVYLCIKVANCQTKLKEEMSTEHIQPSEHGSAFKHQNNPQWRFISCNGTQHVGT